MNQDLLLPGDPTELGGYRLLSRLGSGGMGTVFLGCDPDGRQVAVKIIRPELANQTEFRGRFRSEVNRARSVPAFCTAPVLDADPEHTTPYLVVEYVDGPDLAQVLTDRGPLTGGELHSVAIGVATALTAIHGAGVIHRDLNPKNVMFSPGTLKVIDFGIARAFEATTNFTRTDQMVGTVTYTAPERFDTGGPAAGPAADIFAWGVLITVAGTGRGPFDADSPAATAARILTQPPELGNLPSPLREIVARALAKDPAERPTAPQLLQELLDIGANGPANPPGAPQLWQTARAAQIYASHRPRRRRHLAITVAVAATLGMSAVLITQHLEKPIDVHPKATEGAKAPSTVLLVGEGSSGWRSTQVQAGGDTGFEEPSFDDSSFALSQAGFGTTGGWCPWNTAEKVHTPWYPGTDMLVRRHLKVPVGTTSLHITGTVDNTAEIYIDGKKVKKVSYNYCHASGIAVDVPVTGLRGDIVLAIRAGDHGGETFLDMQVTATGTFPQ